MSSSLICTRMKYSAHWRKLRVAIKRYLLGKAGLEKKRSRRFVRMLNIQVPGLDSIPVTHRLCKYICNAPLWSYIVQTSLLGLNTDLWDLEKSNIVNGTRKRQGLNFEQAFVAVANPERFRNGTSVNIRSHSPSMFEAHLQGLEAYHKVREPVVKLWVAFQLLLSVGLIKRIKRSPLVLYDHRNHFRQSLLRCQTHSIARCCTAKIYKLVQSQHLQIATCGAITNEADEVKTNMSYPADIDEEWKGVGDCVEASIRNSLTRMEESQASLYVAVRNLTDNPRKGQKREKNTYHLLSAPEHSKFGIFRCPRQAKNTSWIVSGTRLEASQSGFAQRMKLGKGVNMEEHERVGRVNKVESKAG